MEKHSIVEIWLLITVIGTVVVSTSIYLWDNFKHLLPRKKDQWELESERTNWTFDLEKKYWEPKTFRWMGRSEQLYHNILEKYAFDFPATKRECGFDLDASEWHGITEDNPLPPAWRKHFKFVDKLPSGQKVYSSKRCR